MHYQWLYCLSPLVWFRACTWMVVPIERYCHTWSCLPVLENSLISSSLLPHLPKTSRGLAVNSSINILLHCSEICGLISQATAPLIALTIVSCSLHSDKHPTQSCGPSICTPLNFSYIWSGPNVEVLMTFGFFGKCSPNYLQLDWDTTEISWSTKDGHLRDTRGSPTLLSSPSNAIL